MSIELLANKADSNVYLQFDTVKGPVGELRKDGMNSLPRKKALYRKFPVGFVGVRGAPDGPELFVNNDRYPFSDSSWDAEVENRGGCRVFRLKRNGSNVIEFEYTPPNLDDLDPWSDDESEDMLYWISVKRRDDEFCEMWVVTEK